MLAQRVTTAIAMLLVCLGALWFAPQWLWTAGVAAVFGVGALEWSRLNALSAGATATLCLLVVLSSAAPLAPVATGWMALAWGLAALFWSTLVPWLLAHGAWPRRASMALGWLVLAPAGAALSWLGAAPMLLLSLLAIVWIADTAAYFSGRRFGRHKLAPSISPGKTWEGVLGALVAVALYVGVLQATGAAGSGPLAGSTGWLLALALTALSVVGDLFESQVKRRAGAKDSGTVLPGHGGVLDRIDGLTSTLPVAALAIYSSLSG